ncbi:MAG TPA: type II toxin-antitoxin system RelE/ParE family toxin [Afifellaceae bacterium]|nr:type II toxin-antitoxin system RelE/ParE family toxin [Afifellaceae bacterium]
MRVRFSAAAIADVKAIREYIAKDDPQAAERVLRRIGGVVDLLRDFPLLGHKGTVPGTFEILVPRLPYIIVYEFGSAEGAGIVVLRVFHGAQDRPLDAP